MVIGGEKRWISDMERSDARNKVMSEEVILATKSPQLNPKNARNVSTRCYLGMHGRVCTYSVLKINDSSAQSHNVILLHKTLSRNELEKAITALGIQGFRGVFMRDT